MFSLPYFIIITDSLFFKNRHFMHCSIIQSICDTCIDNCTGNFDPHSIERGKSKKQRHSTVGSISDIRTTRRSVAPSSTQVVLNHFILTFLIFHPNFSNVTRRKFFICKLESVNNVLVLASCFVLCLAKSKHFSTQILVSLI